MLRPRLCCRSYERSKEEGVKIIEQTKVYPWGKEDAAPKMQHPRCYVYTNKNAHSQRDQGG